MANSSQHPPPSQFHFQLLHSHSHFQNHNQSSPSSPYSSSSSFTHENSLFFSSSRNSYLPLPSSTTDINNNHTADITPLAFQLHASDSHSDFAKLALKQNNEKDNHEAQSSGQAAIPSHSKLVADNTLDPQSATGSKRNNRSKFPKNARLGNQRSNAESLNGPNAATSCRYDSSLGLLTKKFVKLIQEAKDGTLDLNRTADVLEVQKRRIYDITNVLEGVALIEKTSKNHIQWKGYDGCGPKELDAHITKLKTEVESLRDEEHRLDESIREKQELLRTLEEDKNNRRHLFLTEEDITSLPCFQNQMLIAIKAPQASYLEVPDPDGDIGPPQYKMIARSNTGPIDLYLLSKYEKQDDNVAVNDVKPLNSSAWICGSHKVKSEGLFLDQQNDQHNVAKLFSSACSESSGIQKIIPSDCDIDDDYWFLSNSKVSVSDLWGTESE